VSTTQVDANAWHCSLSLRAEEGQLSDEKWGAIAQDSRTASASSRPAGTYRADGFRHGLSMTGKDQVHIAASFVGEDGTKATTHNDFAKAQKVCRDLERDYGLEPLVCWGIGSGDRGAKPAERAPQQQPVPSRLTPTGSNAPSAPPSLRSPWRAGGEPAPLSSHAFRRSPRIGHL
jgi:hypothetical protein